MKMTNEQREQYYADQGIDRRDLLSTDDIRLDELPPDVRLDGPGRSMIEGFVSEWNRLDPLAKIDAAGSMERRVLGRRVSIPAEAWCAYLLLGRVRDSDARREVMLRIARGELTPADVRRSLSGRKRRKPLADEQKREAGAFLAPIQARLRPADIKGVRSERETTEDGATVTVHHVRAIRS